MNGFNDAQNPIILYSMSLKLFDMRIDIPFHLNIYKNVIYSGFFFLNICGSNIIYSC